MCSDELICSDEVREKIEQEIKRFEALPANSSETSVSQDYIFIAYTAETDPHILFMKCPGDGLCDRSFSGSRRSDKT